MARPRDDDVRRKILLATFAAVSRRGVAGISLREIARQAGVSTGTLTYHFTATRQLVLEAIDYGYVQLPPHLDGQSPAETLEWVLQRYVLATERRRAWWRFWLSVTSYADEDAAVQQRLEELHRTLLHYWRAGLDHGQACGTFRDDFDTEAAALRLSAFAHGIAAIQLMDGTLVDWARDELNRQLDRLRPLVAHEGE